METVGVWKRWNPLPNSTMTTVNTTCQEDYYYDGNDNSESMTNPATTALASLNTAPPDADYVLLEHVLAGTGRLGFSGCENECSIGRGPQWFRFRKFVLQNIWGPSGGFTLADATPAGYITFSLSGQSSRPDLVWHFEQEIQLARQIYGEAAVRVVDMAKFSLKEQSQIAADSAVYITNHGGVGATSVFVPDGASVIVYWHKNDRFEPNYYESAGYFHVNWIGVKDRVHVNATMALIDAEIERVALRYPGILAAQHKTSLAKIPSAL